MENKFGRIKAFVEELEKVEIIENQDSLLLLGSIGGEINPRSGNNCQCQGNNCQCSSNNCQCYGNNCQC